MSKPGLRVPLRIPAKCGVVVKTLLDGAIALQLVAPDSLRVVARAVMTAEERRQLGAALVDDALWTGPAGEAPAESGRSRDTEGETNPAKPARILPGFPDDYR